LFLIFALCERKNRKQKIVKYLAAVYPEAPLSLSKGLSKGMLKPVRENERVSEALKRIQRTN
jgi:hypothetical protein